MNKPVVAAMILLGLGSLPALAEGVDGKTGFADSCSACHAPMGEGTPGIAPPLVDAALWSTLGDRQGSYITGVILGGLTGKIEAAGQTYVGLAMPAHNFLADEEIVAIANYVLSDLNGQTPSVDTALVAATRVAVPSHAQLRAMRKAAP
jgi:mono/diheme cytochrome c family protein